MIKLLRVNNIDSRNPAYQSFLLVFSYTDRDTAEKEIQQLLDKTIAGSFLPYIEIPEEDTTSVEWQSKKSNGWTQDSVAQALTEPTTKQTIELAVYSPAHYMQGTMECITAIEGLELGFHAGNVLKYITRYKYKNGIEDLKKAQWYLSRLMELEEKKLEAK